MTTIDLTATDLQQITTEALTGPWEAVLAYRTGEVTTLDDVIADASFIDLDDVEISIVRRSAAPTGPDADGEKRLPGTYNGEDLLVTFENFEEVDEVVARWAQAQAMVDGLNTAAKACAR